ncbi:MAG TPA: hypothetical protein P5144_14155, partial [Thermoanaerobaculia bacterium]|nr:hypothetical protein [Thermoanaerobaculia bacterium]
ALATHNDEGQYVERETLVPAMTSIKVGDVVAWDKVPDGALARRTVDDGGFFYLRRAEEGWCVGKMQDDGERYFEALPANLWPWRFKAYEAAPVTIVALGLTGQETADDLRRIAEVFEVWEALHAMQRAPTAGYVLLCEMAKDEDWRPLTWHQLAERLHAAGWRPGMTAEDAARLLSEAQS